MTRILIVDEEPAVAQTLCWVFERNGLEARTCDSAAAALETAAQFRPNIVLCDSQLPDANGIDTAFRIRSFLSRCKIALMSGRNDASQLARSLSDCGNVFSLVAKPIDARELLQQLGLEDTTVPSQSRQPRGRLYPPQEKTAANSRRALLAECFLTRYRSIQTRQVSRNLRSESIRARSQARITVARILRSLRERTEKRAGCVANMAA